MFNPRMEGMRKINFWIASINFFTEVPTDSANFFQDTHSVSTVHFSGDRHRGPGESHDQP